MMKKTRAKGSKVNLRIRKEGIRERANARLGRGHQIKNRRKSNLRAGPTVAGNGTKPVLAQKESVGRRQRARTGSHSEEFEFPLPQERYQGF